MLDEKADGIAGRRWDSPVTLDLRFDVASVTKLFTSVAALQQVAAVLQQVEAGALDLEPARRIDPLVVGNEHAPDAVA